MANGKWQMEGSSLRVSPLPFAIYHFASRRYAAIFVGVPSVTDAIIGPPPAPLLTPKLTLNCAHAPTAVERAAWIWYVTCDDPAGTVASMKSLLPVPPKYVNSPLGPMRRQTW